MSDVTTGRRIELTAPLTGIMVPIELVPDPVFARKMVGEGFSIDPLANELLAPIAGEIADLQPSAHAVTIRSADGLEVLIHVGLDTVKMGGEGFTAKVRAGDHVDIGDPLLEFDLDKVATTAKSLLTQVVIANSDRIARLVPRAGLVTAGRDIAAEIELAEPGTTAEGTAPGGRTITSDALLIPNPTGLHARPAATLVALAKTFGSDVRLRHGADSANAKSIMALMGLALARGDKVTVTANGADAEKAIAEISQAIRGGLGEDCPPIGPAPAGDDGAGLEAGVGLVAGAGLTEGVGLVESGVPSDDSADEPTLPASGDPDLLLGASASPGLGIGRVVQWRHADIAVEEVADNHHMERRKLNAAIDRALLDLSALQNRLEHEADADKAAIFGAHQEILADPELLDLAVSAIDKGRSAPYAWRAAYLSYADLLAKLPNEVLAGRANDVRDVGQRVLEELTGQRSERAELAEGTILVAEDLTPSDTAGLDPTRVVGFATTSGGASSHVAIIARSLEIPAVAGIEGRALDIPEGTTVVLDGAKGTLRLNVSEDDIAAIRERQRRQAERKAIEQRHKDEPATTPDGRRITVGANIGSVDDARASQTRGADGVGLLRSEFVFLDRRTAPSVEEQAQIYADCARALQPGQPLVIRTLDVGGDKPLPYLPLPPEENPFLGVRGVRVGLEKPDVLRAQCRAILRAADAGAALHVMFPMIATIDDWRSAKAIWDEERDRSDIDSPVSVGIMMEVPSVAVMARQFAAEPGCDFFSVGTNDLTSYVLAMDRGHPKLAAQVDPCNPAVLRLIGDAALALHEQGKWIGVCGGVASDPQAVPILVGLGVDELSCSIPAIPAVKAMVRAHTFSACQALAARAVTCATPAEVRALVPMDDA